MKQMAKAGNSRQLKMQSFVCKSQNMISCSCSDVIAGEVSGDEKSVGPQS